MKRYFYFILLTLVLVACGTDGSHFKIEGRFLNLNQGEFYVYSLDGESAQLDTIKINGGRFSKKIDCEKPQTFMLVFPNFSEQPLFAVPGKSVDVKADASHLKEMEVKGTSDNELMTSFRKKIANASPIEATKTAAMFINDNPKTPVAVYLLRRYYLQNVTPNYAEAQKLVETLLKKQPENGQLINMKKAILSLRNSAEGGMMPSYSTYDVKGEYVNTSSLRGKVGVINSWATWNFESQNTQRELRRLYKQHGSQLAIISVSLDASKRECTNVMQRDSITWPNICDGMLFDSPAVEKLGLKGVSDNIIVDKKGKIVAHGLPTKELIERINKMLK